MPELEKIHVTRGEDGRTIVTDSAGNKIDFISSMTIEFGYGKVIANITLVRQVATLDAVCTMVPEGRGDV